MTWRTALRDLIDAAGADELPDVLGELERARAVVLRRFLNGDGAPEPEPSSEPEPDTDQLLTVEQLAERLNVTPDYVYRNASQWPFTRRLSPKMLRFSEAGLRRWLAVRR